MYYIFTILLFIVITGCSSQKDPQIKHEVFPDKTEKSIICTIPPEKKSLHPDEIYDLIHVPQDAEFFTKNIVKTNNTFYDIQKNYERRYFSVWNMKKPQESLQEILWPFSSFVVGKSYGANLRPLEQDFFDAMITNANFEKYGSVNAKAVTLHYSNLRAFPTLRPLFKDPNAAGEGFPFDYLQNSSIHANEPLFVSHYSKDGAWVYVFTSYASGWIQKDEIVLIKEAYAQQWQKAQKVAIIKENEPIYDDKGQFLFYSKIGMLFALIAEDAKTYTILTLRACKNANPLFMQSKISKEIAVKRTLRLNAENLTTVIREVSQTDYGWGGLYEQRDCSSMLRDMFTPFGIWLPRNSYRQSRIGKVIDLVHLSEEEKIKTIKKSAIPFQTLLYKKGHIVLYVGIYDNDIIVFHNTWGIKTKKSGKDGRIIVGKTIFSTLELGKYQDDYDEEGSILKNLVSMNIITH